MAAPCIDADYQGEERYTKITLAYDTEEQYKEINNALAKIHEELKLDRRVYLTENTSTGRKLFIIEYHDDYDREANAVFEKLMQLLGIEQCEL